MCGYRGYHTEQAGPILIMIVSTQKPEMGNSSSGVNSSFEVGAFLRGVGAKLKSLGAECVGLGVGVR